MPAVGLFGAFLAGLLSFFSPCVLPLTPIYVAQLVGPSVWRNERADSNELRAATRDAAARGGVRRRLLARLHRAGGDGERAWELSWRATPSCCARSAARC